VAAPTLTNVPVTIDAAEATTNWSSATLDPDIKRQGNNSVSDSLRQDGATFAFSYGSATLLNNQVLRLWCTNNLTPYLESYANEGLSFYTTDSVGNTRYYTVAGFDTYNGGWLNLAIKYASTIGSTSGTSTTTTQPVSEIGIRFTRTSQPRVGENIWLDYLRRGAGYTATGGTSVDPITPDTIATTDNSNGYGILLKEDGVLFCSGVITLGSGATATDFDSVGDLIVFVENPYMDATGYQIVGEGSGCNLFFDGTVFKTAGTITNNKFIFDLSDSTTTATVTGCLFDKGNTIDFASGHSVTSNTFNGCGLITPGGATFTGNVIKGSTGTVAVTATPGQMANITGNTFNSNSNHAVEVTGTAANFTWNNADDGNYDTGTAGDDVAVTTPTGNETIFVNIASGSLDITVGANANNTPSVRSAGATVNVVAGLTTITITDLKSNSDVIVFNASTNATIASTSGSGTSFQFQASASTTVHIHITNLSYLPYYRRSYVIPSTNQDLPVSQVTDRVYENPVTAFDP